MLKDRENACISSDISRVLASRLAHCSLLGSGFSWTLGQAEQTMIRASTKLEFK